ncbi:MAG TPA: sigma-70 family RNA polymerase sigma factor [Blastocatellia bacterium]|nr:sigma-70 family RNA polymerase sigma factor [Blastocatellia bacterium]
MEPSDEALVLACLKGDEAAWEALIRRYERLVYTVPRRAGLDEDASTEVFQTVFATLVEKLDRIEQPDRIAAWLVTTAKRATWRLVYSQKQLRSSAADEESHQTELDQLADESPLPDQAIERLETQHQVRMAVGALDQRCRDLLTVLFYRPEPPAYSEVAAALGMTHGSIGPTRARCLQKLLALLEKAGF